MFTGIIEDIGTITGINKMGGKWEFAVKTNLTPFDIREGDSISVNGVCLTVTKTDKGVFSADASLETLNRTTLKDSKTSQRVNIERAMGAGGRFGGHIVTGHVDAIGTITEIKQAGDSRQLSIEIPPDISRYFVQKGSVAIDGISLTVNEQHGNTFTVNIIPYTASRTTIGEKNLRERVNIETDIIGRYVESFLVRNKQKEIDLGFLADHGYIKGDR
ncbi:MAG TPA: riboflavin synthase [Syntrophorhabdaceae bacterium]|nr:riboflavin synthase [Syntrophorhabdaceae bacterium]HQM80687.1 riboflavin synthase [Syntrophorhabdaceae bacterium]